MIRVGGDYQAQIPEFKPGKLGGRKAQQKETTEVDEYILMAKEKHGYNMEQALGMLLWHKHDVERSLADLANFTPFPDEWTVEDKVLFEQAFSFHGKSFHRIQQMLPDKLISSLVKYYYSWKKTRTRTSVMDRQARRNNFCEVRTDSDKATPSRSGPVKKENIGAQYRHHPLRARRRPPKGMHLEQADIMSLSASHDAGVLTIRQLDTQLVSLKRQVPGSASLCPHSLPRQLSISPRLAQVSSFFVSYRRRFNLDEVLREWAAEQVATSRDQRDPRRSGEEMATATDGGVEEEEVRTVNTQKVPVRVSREVCLREVLVLEVLFQVVTLQRGDDFVFPQVQIRQPRVLCCPGAEVKGALEDINHLIHLSNKLSASELCNSAVFCSWLVLPKVMVWHNLMNKCR
uniref:REST corepressor 2 n=1 Tax=Neolamprologus brichardi TaxID=32507 RepID=A0A3Q4GFA8_NEOBR